MRFMACGIPKGSCFDHFKINKLNLVISASLKLYNKNKIALVFMIMVGNKNLVSFFKHTPAVQAGFFTFLNYMLLLNLQFQCFFFVCIQIEAKFCLKNLKVSHQYL